MNRITCPKCDGEVEFLLSTFVYLQINPSTGEVTRDNPRVQLEGASYPWGSPLVCCSYCNSSWSVSYSNGRVTTIPGV